MSEIFEAYSHRLAHSSSIRLLEKVCKIKKLIKNFAAKICEEKFVLRKSRVKISSHLSIFILLFFSLRKIGKEKSYKSYNLFFK